MVNQTVDSGGTLTSTVFNFLHTTKVNGAHQLFG